MTGPRERRFRLTSAAVVAVALAGITAVIVAAGSLSSINPTSASAGIPVSINGTGFNTTAGQNEVAFTSQSGATASATPSRVVAGTGLLVLTVTVPAGLPVGPATVRVTNRTTGEISEGLSLNVLDLRLTGAVSGARGSTNLNVPIQGSFNSNFVQGASRAVFGAGVTVHSTTVTSPTTLIANISIAATAALGPRQVGVASPNQQAILPAAFTITEVGTPANQAPSANAGGSYSGQTGANIAFNGSGTDPDPGDTLTFSWNFGDGSLPVASAQTSHSYANAGTYTATLTVKDNKGAAATATAQVSVTAPPPPPPPQNKNPAIISSPVTTGTEGQAYAYDVNATDPDAGDTLVYELTTAPTGMTINGGTGVIAWTPLAAQVPSASVTVRVTDGKGGSDTQSFTVAVAAAPTPNQQPIITSSPVTSGTEGQAYAYDVNATDPDAGDTLVYELTTAPTGMTINGGTGVMAWTPLAAQVPSASVTVRVTDGKGGSDTQSFTIAVAAAPTPNQQPTITSSPVTTGTEGQAYAYDVNATDPDAGDTLVYELTTAPSGMTINGGTGVIAWTPLAAQVPSASVTVRVTDGKGGSDTQSFTIAVAAAPTPNQQPTITSSPVTTGTEGQAYAYDVNATDPDAGDTLVYELTTAPTGMTINGGTGVIAWTPLAAQVPSASVTVRVTDGKGGSDTQSFTIAVAAAPTPNQQPTITSSPVTTGTEGQAYAYDVNATDPDAGDTLVYELTTAPTGMTINGGTGVIAWTPLAAQVPSASVTVRVTDGKGGSDTQSFTIAVAAAPTPNQQPTITSSPVTTGTEGQAYAYDVNATDPDAGDTLVYELTTAPTGMTINGGTGVIAWTPLAAQVPSANVTVRVTDGKGGAATQSFTVAIAAANGAPQITSAPVTTARELLAYSYQVTATDPNSDPLTYTLTLAPAGMTINQTTGLIAWTPPVNPPASADVVVSVSDPGLAKATQSFAIAIAAVPQANQPPHITSSPNLAGQVLQSYSYDVQADDPDPADTLTYSLVQPPAGMTIDPSSGLIAWTPTAAQSGAIAISVKVSDGRDFASQTFEIAVAAAPNVNRPPAANVGGPYQGEAAAAIDFNGKKSSDPDGDALSFSWNFGDGSAVGTGDAPNHVYAASGAFIVTLTVTDGRGGESVASTTVAIGSAGDRAPPSVSLLGPREVLPGDQVTITAQATDNIRVDKVTFQVDGANPSDSLTQPFQRSITVPSVASPGTEILVSATATDPSGNTGSAETTLTIKARPDTEKPTVTLNAPPLTAPGSAIRLTATAQDNSGVQSVAFAVNGGAVVTLSQPPYETTYQVPQDAPVGAALAVTVFALDFSGNRGDAAGSVNVVATPDLQPPTVQLTARATTVPGAQLDLNASAADNRGVSQVQFFVDGVKIATDTDAPYAAVFAVPTTAPAGRVLQLEARAIDFAGLEGTDSQQTQVVSTSSLAQGVIASEVYDDTTGLPVTGAAIALTGRDAGGNLYTQTTTSDSRGRYLLRATEGSGIVRITRSGWTRVDRSVDIVANKSVEILDARLTPIATGAATINPVLGATVSGPQGSAISLIVPPGALQASVPLAATPISQQGLEGVLPPGWSPIAVADVTPHAAVFTTPATLSMPGVQDVPAAAQLALVRWDEETASWYVVASRTGSAALLAHPIVEAGQYAWVLADSSPATPASPIAGAVLAGVIAGPVPVSATSVVSPESKVVFYQPGVKTEVTGLVTVGAAIPSGTAVFSRISESYKFTSGLEAHLEPYVEDLILYQTPGAGLRLNARYIVTPTLSFEPATLQSGVITVDLFEPPPGPRLSDIIGDSGGSTTTTTGERVDVPAGGLSTPAPVLIQALSAEALGFTLPATVSFAGAMQVSASGAQFTGPVTLSIPKPAQFPADGQILIARVTELGATTRLVLVAIGRVVGERIESSTALGTNPAAFEGARVSGRYVFLRPTSPVGFAAGLVRAVNGDPFGGGLVSADTLPLFALSGAAGQYVAAASTGAVSLLAQDLLRNDTGSAQGSIAAAGGVLPIDLRLSAQAPAVLSVTPASQAVNVPLSSAVVVTFSEPVNPNSVTAASVLLTGPGGAPVTGTISLSNNNTIVTLRPTDPLAGDASYTVTIAATISDLSGYTLPQAFTSQFASLDVTAPAPPPAGAISATIPGAGGTTTISGSQGTAGLHDTVSIINVTRGASTPVLLDPNGGFSVIVQAGLNDKLQIKIVDPAGNASVIPIARFSQTNADGSVSSAVGNEGGRVDGPGGTAADVPAGAFPDGAVVTIKPVSEAEFPVQLPAAAADLLGWSGGVRVDFGGQVPKVYVNVSIPAGPEDKVTDQWIVSQAVEVNGQQMMQMIDTAKLISNRIQTSSPPCPGVTGAGVYGIHKTKRPMGLNYGVMYASGYGGITARLEFPFLGTLSTVIPFMVLGYEFPRPVCIPALTGRVTVSANSQQISVPASELHGDDREIVIRNTTRGGEYHFPRNVLEYAFKMLGSVSDNYEVKLRDAFGVETLATGVDVKAAPPDSVTITIDADSVTTSVAEVAIRNITKGTLSQHFISSVATVLSVGGGAGDSFVVNATTASGVSRPVGGFSVIASPLGGGNLVAKGVAGAIDPTQAQIDAHNAANPSTPVHGVGVSAAILFNETTQASHPIPLNTVVDGAFQMAFAGSHTDQYAVRVTYDDGRTDYTRISNFRIVVTNPRTGRVIKTIETQAPPRDEPLNLGTITDDTQPPILTLGPQRLNSFDPSGYLTFTFSEAMNADSLKNGIIVERVVGGQRTRVAGTVRVSSGNTVATFVPLSPLQIASEYSVTFVGGDSLAAMLVPGGSPVVDRGGNALSTQRFRIKTFSPKLVGYHATTGNVGDPLPLKDVAILRRKVGDELKTHLAITAGTQISGQSYRLLSLDVTDPATPVELGREFAGSGKQRITVIEKLGAPGGPPALPFREAASWCTGAGARTGASFTGDLAVTTSFNTYYSYFSFFDVSQPQPCLINNKLLTTTPDLVSDYNRRGTIHAQGFARGVATIQHSTGFAAYAAVGEVGIFAADIGKNIPELGPTARIKEGMYAGDYFDVVNVSDRLLAANYSDSKLELFDPNLALLGSIDLPDQPRRITTVRGYGFDENEDGLITPDESLDLAIVACQGSIQIVDITNTDQMQVIGSIKMPGIVRDLDFDAEKRRLFAGGEAGANVGAHAFYMIDLSNPRRSGLLDADGDLKDDRIVWQRTFAEGVFGFRIDRERGLAYLPTGNGLNIWAVYDLCCDLGVDLTAKVSNRQGGSRAALLQKEKEALQAGIKKGLEAAAQECGLPASGFSILEQGSGACLWKANPEAACSDNYQPGLSDHDFEIFLPDAIYDAKAVCTATVLNRQFKNPDTGEPEEIEVNGSKMSFSDITFFAEVKERFESATFDVEPPGSSGGSDEVGDIGLGRRQLLLKWLLEGEYIQVPGYSLAGRNLESILTTLRTTTGIPRLEGHEWAYLQAFSLAKSKVFLRIKGASNPQSSLYSTYIKQLHDAGKAGIRATLARMVADAAANPRVLNVTRASYARDGCIGIDPLIVSPNSWPAKPCTSFEEYVASAAARTLRYPSALSIFTRDEVVNQVARFANVKSDRERITSEAKADQFIALASSFVEATKAQTQSIYTTLLPLDPDRIQRGVNLAAAVQHTTTAMGAATVALKPHIFNRGFRPGDQIVVDMYRADSAGAGGAPITTTTTNIAGGEDQYFSFRRKPDGALELDSNNKPIPVFALPPVNMNADFGVPHGLSFTIDLPLATRKMKEAVRENNYGGFWYYVLDRANPVPPVTSAKPPLPVAADLLDPDAACDDSPLLSITQRLVLNGQILEGDVDLGFGETASIQLTVVNLSGDPQQSVLACSNVTNQCYDAGTLAPGEIKTLTVPFTAPLEGRYLAGTPTASSPDAGIVTGASFNVMVSCEAYAVVSLDSNPRGNPNPERSSVMLGGKTYRYYRVVNRRTGAPKANATVKLDLRGFFGAGFSTQSLSFTTDDRGIISTPTEPGIVISTTAGMLTGTTYYAKVVEVNGVPLSCAQPVEYEIDLKDREYSESYTRGVAISGAIGIPFLGIEGSREAGMTLKKNHKFMTGVQSMDISEAFETQGKIGSEFALFEFKLGVGVLEAKASAEIGISGAKSNASGATYSFPYPLDQDENCAIAYLTMTGMLGVNPLIPDLLDLLRAEPCSDLSRYVTSATREFGRSATDNGKFDLGVSTPFTVGSKKVGVKFGASGSAGFGLKTTYEDNYVYNATSGVLDQTTLKEAYQLTGGFDFSVGLTVGLSAPPNPDDDEKQTELEEVSATKFKQAIGLSGSGSTVETYKVEFEYDLKNLPDHGNPSAIGITYTSPKTWGWKRDIAGLETKLNNGTPGTSSTFTYRIDNPADVTAMVETLANMKAIRDTNVQNNLAFLELQLVPTILNEEYSKFRTLLRKIAVTYSVQGSAGGPTEIPFGVKGKLVGFKLGAGLTIKSDEKVEYAKETGAVVKGVMYPLEKYTDDNYIPPPSTGLIDVVETAWDSLLASFASSFSDKTADVNAAGGPTSAMQSDATARIVINNTAEPTPFAAGLFSYKYRVIAGPVKEARALPSDTAGAPGKPHYGVGGFHQLTPEGKVLGAPASLVIDYQDSELDGIDESSLAIFAWNATTRDWDLVGGTLDPVSNTVSTTITTFRLYTLGAKRMPAKEIALTFGDLGATGTDGDMVQRFSVTGTALTTNTGEGVPDGTLYTIKSVVGAAATTLDYGTIVATDADPAREGIQVASSGGTISFTVEYPSPFGFYTPGRAAVFSVIGTAFGETTLVRNP